MGTGVDDAELARRSVVGFGEMIAALGLASAGPEAVVRRPGALGARNGAAAGNPWFDAAVVPPGVAPPADHPELPLCLWSVADAVPGRVEEPAIATPCMGLVLDDPALAPGADAAPEVESPPLAVVGGANERAYGETGFTPMLSALRDARVRTHGLREGGEWVCVALTLRVGDDLGIHFVATEAAYRRRSLATRLVRAVMAAARQEGMRTATLQASADGLPVWTRLGFRRVATLRGYLRPG